MARTRVYPPEFRAKILELVRSGKNVSAIAREYEVARLTITNWLKQDDLDAGRRSDGLTTAESVEVAKLRKKVRELEIERDILKKAAADSMGRCNTLPVISNGGVANGSARAPGVVAERESRTVEALEARRIAK